MKKLEAARPQSRRDYRDLWALALIVAALLAAYSNSFTSGFVFDNKAILLQDPRIREASSQNLSDIFSHTYWWPTGESGLYRPLTTLTYLFNYAVLGDGDQPGGYHAINLLLHAQNAMCLYFLLLRITAKYWAALLSALLWSVHPVLTEAVTNIVGRADLLAGLALLGGLLIYLKAGETTGWTRAAWLAGLAAVAAAGAFSKESAVVLPAMIALYEVTWWRERKPARSRIAPAAIAVAVPILVFLIRRAAVLASSPAADFPFFDNPITGAGFWVGRLTALKVLARYLSLVAWPARLSADYSYNQIPLTQGAASDWISWIVMALVVAGAVWFYRRNPAIFFLAGFAFLAILPASNLLVSTGTMMAERLIYLSAAGVVACFVLGALAAAERFGKQRAAAILLCGIACALAARTWSRNRDWQDDLTLARATVSASPQSFKAHQMLAEALFLGDAEHRDVEDVLAEAERGIAILDPLPDARSSPELYRLAGACYLLKGDRMREQNRDSMEEYRRARAVLQRGAAILNALRAGRSAPFVASSNDDIFRLLSAADLRLGRVNDAKTAAQEASKRDPLNPDVYVRMSEALESAGDRSGAAAQLMLGMLVTSDMGLRMRLIELYGRGLDQNHCAVMQGPNGPAINPACELVRKQLCGVSSDAVRISVNAGKANTAHALKNSFVKEYGCPAEPLERLLPD